MATDIPVWTLPLDQSAAAFDQRKRDAILQCVPDLCPISFFPYHPFLSALTFTPCFTLAAYFLDEITRVMPMCLSTAKVLTGEKSTRGISLPGLPTSNAMTTSETALKRSNRHATRREYRTTPRAFTTAARCSSSVALSLCTPTLAASWRAVATRRSFWANPGRMSWGVQFSRSLLNRARLLSVIRRCVYSRACLCLSCCMFALKDFKFVFFHQFTQCCLLLHCLLALLFPLCFSRGHLFWNIGGASAQAERCIGCKSCSLVNGPCGRKASCQRCCQVNIYMYMYVYIFIYMIYVYIEIYVCRNI